MKVKKLMSNWHQTGTSTNSFGVGIDKDVYEVGENDVYEIEENEPNNGLQKWNYVIKYNNGKAIRIFNPNYVEYFKADKK